MGYRPRLLASMAVVGLFIASDALACGDKFLVSSRGTRYQRPKNARAANVLIYANPSSGLPAALEKVPVDSLLKREGHKPTTVGTLEQLTATLASGRFDVVLVSDTVMSAVQTLLGAKGAPVLVSLCVRASGTDAKGGSKDCSLKAPPKERSLLEAIDRAVLQYDKNAKKAQAHG